MVTCFKNLVRVLDGVLAPALTLKYWELLGKFCIAYSTSTGSILFKQYLYKSCKTFQLTNQSAFSLKPTKFLI